MRIQFHLLIALTIALVGCQYKNPNKNQTEFYQDKSKCMAESNQQYPVMMVTTYNKNGQPYTYDHNALARASSEDICLQANGWTR